ncbi:MAG: TonB family protein [Phycisphaerales bacterium]|nr:TonB family protein [Phycisphaerales bacterium]
MRSDQRVWLFGFATSIAAHAALFAVLGAVRARIPPELTMPAGDSSGVRVLLLPREPRESIENPVEDPPPRNEPAEKAPAVEPSQDPHPSTATAPASLHAPAQDAAPDIGATVAALRAADAATRAWLQAMASRVASIGGSFAGRVVRTGTVPPTGPPAEVRSSDPGPAATMAVPVPVQSQTTPPLSSETAALIEASIPPERPGGSVQGVTRGPRPAPTNRPPTYPPEALRRRQSGSVLVHLVIGDNGAVVTATLVRSSGVDLLDNAALDAARKWRFHPAIENGVAVPCEVDLPIEFVLR